MSIPHVRTGIITIDHGELMAWISSPIKDQLYLGYDGPGVLVPLPAGVGNGPMADMDGKELRAYLEHGMAFEGDLTLRDVGDGLKLTGAKDLRNISTPDAREQLILKGVSQAAEMLASYREARIKAGIEVSISDWQGDERPDKTTPDNIRIKIQAEEQRLLMTARDGRKIDIEMQDGVLRSLAFEAEDGKDAPVITKLPISGDITTDREDYDREDRVDPDDPGF
ncbi:hypothetical protein [Pseudosulfitobacter pseudonitzschiae]|uniref:hypothetical protein n=1 Tax=Pseudosulfitobacter pseudonitzschiae TaxID=1402135 RepID=UPI003B7FFF57